MQDLNTQIEPEEALKFKCPNCGVITRDDVIFLCNTCQRNELIFKDGVYMCPDCLIPGENFQCMHCDSKDVKMVLLEHAHKS